VFFPGGIALDASFVYWGEPVGGNAIRRVPKAGGTVVDLGRGQGFGPASIALDAAFVYGVGATGGGNFTGMARRIPIGGGTVQTLATGLQNAFSAVVDDTSLYWVELANPGMVRRVAKSGGTVLNLAQNLANPHNVAIDSQFAYYGGASDTNRLLHKVPKSGGSPVDLPDCAGGLLVGAIQVAVDDTSIYFTDNGNPANGIPSKIIKMSLTPNSICADSNVSLFTAVLPSSRSVMVGGTPATAFLTALAPSGCAAQVGISLAPVPSVPANLTYQTTDPTTNKVTGTPNTPIDIPAGGGQSFVVALTPTAPFNPVSVGFNVAGSNTLSVGTIPGVNLLTLSASATPVPDIVALAATLGNDGIVNIPGATGTGIFAVATVNVGVSAAITASAGIGQATFPAVANICQTNPSTGACLAPPAGSVTTTIAANATPTFGIFVQGTATIPFDPANNRISVRFRDAAGIERGSTSVAVRTQ
jgi:hypothetical protein